MLTIYTIKVQSKTDPRHVDYIINTIHGKRQETLIEKTGVKILEITKTECGPDGPKITKMR